MNKLISDAVSNIIKKKLQDLREIELGASYIIEIGLPTEIILKVIYRKLDMIVIRRKDLQRFGKVNIIRSVPGKVTESIGYLIILVKYSLLRNYKNNFS